MGSIVQYKTKIKRNLKRTPRSVTHAAFTHFGNTVRAHRKDHFSSFPKMFIYKAKHLILYRCNMEIFSFLFGVRAAIAIICSCIGYGILSCMITVHVKWCSNKIVWNSHMYVFSRCMHIHISKTGAIISFDMPSKAHVHFRLRMTYSHKHADQKLKHNNN